MNNHISVDVAARGIVEDLEIEIEQLWEVATYPGMKRSAAGRAITVLVHYGMVVCR